MAGEDKQQVATPAGIDVPASAAATCAQLVAILRDACTGIPMEAEPGDFLVALDRNAQPESGR
ncbi:MAG TPA: hypothetical protein VHL31_15640 [Geminicoccus sp.]|jgi:hypothetical protein|uniref:hypothetical protein n=1 Tax=Geminicoccus sp. TaxID=2024832 RepID=UPI002E37E30E|nr:hypothetical protein [Geminicoccus sp.]HEX2527715.1 hypothetical protein [Geminicoccus sp.]